MTRRGRWLFGRIVATAVMLVIVSAIIFIATQALPGDVATMILGKDATPAQIEQLRRQLRLDQPLVAQYFSWLLGVVMGDLGRSSAAQLPVSELIGQRIGNSFALVVISMLISLPASVVSGLFAGFRKDTVFDKTLLSLSLAVNAIPEFVLGLLLVVLFSTNVFHILPAVSVLSPERGLFSQWQALVLPVMTLVLLQTSYLYRLIRGAVIDVLSMDYIQFSQLRGLSTSRILWHHVLPNAALPAVQAAATVFAYSVGGVVVIEYVFGYPGIGTALADAVGNRDISVVQAIVLLIATVFFIANIFADAISLVLVPPARGDST